MENIILFNCLSNFIISFLLLLKPIDGGIVNNGTSSESSDLDAAKQWLKDYEIQASDLFYQSTLAAWNYQTNITEYNKNISDQSESDVFLFRRRMAEMAGEFQWQNLTDLTVRKQFQFITDIGLHAVHNETLLKKIRDLETTMQDTYKTAKVCLLSADNCLQLDPDIKNIFATSRDYDELKRLWTGWRIATGHKLRDTFSEYVNLTTTAIQSLGTYQDLQEYLRSVYELEEFDVVTQQLLEQVLPLYRELHTFVRGKLKSVYKDHTFPHTGHIPAHLLGDIWGSNWKHIYNIVEPYMDRSTPDVSVAMRSKNLTDTRMFEEAEEFFRSIGFPPLGENFWNNSMLRRPLNRSVDCHPSAWDFFNGKDFRIKMCTDVNLEGLLAVYHEMGYTVSQMAYSKEPLSLRYAANPGFHEAIGDLIPLSVMTPQHLHRMGLIDSASQDKESSINFLMGQALQKLSYLPFSYVVDKWKSDAFSGRVQPDQYNTHWWGLRCKYEGLSPPVDAQSEDFDPGSMYHVVSRGESIKYFLSTVLQFQFHKSLCDTAGHRGPLHQCDIYNSTQSGHKLYQVLELGSSRPWPDALEILTGQRRMDAGPLLEYFQPLADWLKDQNKGQSSGWFETCPSAATGKVGDVTAAWQWVVEYNGMAAAVIAKTAEVEWNYDTNITEYNRNKTERYATLWRLPKGSKMEETKIMLQINVEMAEFKREASENASVFDWPNFENATLRRLFKKISTSGHKLEDRGRLQQLKKLKSEMETIYSTANICLSNGQCLQISPGLTKLMATSRNYSLLSEAWDKWRKATGGRMKDNYQYMITLLNQVAQSQGFNDHGEQWRSLYEMPNFSKEMENLLEQLKPLYENLHAYVRHKLKSVYGEEKFPYSGHIPDHLLGNMWSQQWNNIYDIVEPYKGKIAIDITPKLQEMKLTAKNLFKIAEEFFSSLGLKEMPDSFWKNSMMTKPADRDVVCHPSAWDFRNGSDFRIKMCTEINMEDLFTIHHEMGHIEYFMQYMDQPIPFRSGANPGFHEAIGDVMELSVATPEHLYKLGFLDELQNDEENDINFLMLMALKKVAFLPFGYLIDLWRWSVFSGETTQDQYNQKWWELRCKYHGTSPPVKRSEEDFDPGSKYHVAANVPYIRYFVSFILQFQLHKILCNVSGHRGPLHRCDIYRSKSAGAVLRELLQAGSSEPWQDILQKVTGQSELSVMPMLEYFQPLSDWLEKQNANISIGWQEVCRDNPEVISSNETEARLWLDGYNSAAEVAESTYYEIYWNYVTNLTDYNKQRRTEADVAHSDFTKAAAHNASLFEWKNFSDPQMKKQFRMLVSGVSGFKDKRKIKEFASVSSDLEYIYSMGKSCITNDTCLEMEPDLTNLIANSRNYTELLLAWKGWRDATGAKMKDKYARFVTLRNELERERGIYADAGEHWRSWYETPTLQEDLVALLDQLKGLYKQLHTYVRGKLEKVYGRENFPPSGHIPAHLLGNMWAQNWINIYDLVVPYPNKSSPDLTQTLIDQNYTVMKLFKTAEDFFVSLNLSAMPEEFWNKSILERPKDGRDMVCHPSAWDFGNAKDFRIKMCTDINMETFRTIHHEMGHIQYYIQYKDQPFLFRSGANPGFHEAVGDVVAMSVVTPAHLHQLGLLGQVTSDYESDINFLMTMALKKIAFLPFGYLIDQWRWSVFSGETTPEHYNEKWWDLRCRYQGVSPPVDRTEADFDPGAKYHIPGNTPYIRYFISYVIQFQFHEALCTAAGHKGPLHTCDIYRSTRAGNLLGRMLKLGSSKPWPDAMEALTGQRQMSVQPMINYFRPLINWLAKQNKDMESGWEPHCGIARKRLINDEAMARQWLKEYNTQYAHRINHLINIQWQYSTNITDYNYNIAAKASEDFGAFNKESASKASLFNWKDLKDISLRKQFKLVVNDFAYHMKPDRYNKRSIVMADMGEIYNKGKVCLSKERCVPLTPDLNRIMATSRNYSELENVWKSWRDVVGRQLRDKYTEYVELQNEGAQLMGYRDIAEVWKSWYNDDTAKFSAELQNLMDQITPLYQHIHTYVRNKLRKIYKSDRFPSSGHIPAHLLGNMWAQDWLNLYELLTPYPGRANVDITPAMVQQNYTVRRMFKLAEEFFTSLGLPELPITFWEKSQFVRPDDGREVLCHASAWDFFYEDDVRISMCTTITMEDLVTVHHEIGHNMYDLLYSIQPVRFRDGANPGFHEAVGDTLALSVATPKHLHKIGLLDSVKQDKETTINFLMRMGLEKIVFLPFAFTLEQWRWNVFSGNTTEKDYNKDWWKLRCKYQGISPPVQRSEEDFDPGAKYHIPASTPYIRYFVSHVLQFQFLEALCKEAGHVGPLYECDIYRSKQAGAKLRQMLKLGSSKPWEDALEVLTGQRNMDAGPFFRYFKPLIDWLEKENEGQTLGWEEQCSPKTIREEASDWLAGYERDISAVYYSFSEASWNYATNITEENEDEVAQWTLKLSESQKEAAKHISRFDKENLQDADLKRQLTKAADIGSSAMSNTTKLVRMSKVQSEMLKIYSTGSVCVSQDVCLQLEPGLTKLMSDTHDYDMLLKAWVEWRNVAGRPIRPLYQEFVQLSNEAISALGYEDTGAYWRSAYECTNFEQDVEDLMVKLSPLYENLHAYVRRELVKEYGADKFPSSGHIPAHLLGDMWGQFWMNIFDIVKPYKDTQSIDITYQLTRQNYTVTKMFKTAEEFYVSLGFSPLPDSFWKDSMLKRPDDGRNVSCHATAWMFFNSKDFRIKMCTIVNMENWIIIYHELGHIQYFIQSKDLPFVYRGGANPGFHEAVGDVISLYASTPKHLSKVGLVQNYQDNYSADINFLMLMALDKIAFLPFGYLIDQWRWSVFSNKTSPQQYNFKWWELRCKYQGISPPVQRTEADFDPGAKYHIPSNHQFISYFVSYIIQFQFHKSMCEAAGHQGALYKCDIYNSKEAGKILGDMLKLGSSVPWPDAMEKITGQRKMDAQPLIDYFQPLIDWLEKENYNERVGWSDACPKISKQVSKTTHSPAVQNHISGTSQFFSQNCYLIISCLFLILVSIKT